MNYQELEFSLTITLIAISVILLVVDIFLSSGVASQTGYLLLTITIVKGLELHPFYMIAAGVIIWGAFQLTDLLLWSRISKIIKAKYISPFIRKMNKTPMKGKVKSIDGRQYLSLNGQLYEFESTDGKPGKLGATYEIKKFENERVLI